MASLRGLNGFEVTSTEIVLDRARTRLGESRIFFDIDKWKGFKDKKPKVTSFFTNLSKVYKFFILFETRISTIFASIIIIIFFDLTPNFEFLFNHFGKQVFFILINFNIVSMVQMKLLTMIYLHLGM